MDEHALQLAGFQKKYLRKLAHDVKAVVQVGDAGLGDAIHAAVDTALRDHELVKVRLRRPEDKREDARRLASRAGAALCGLVGHTVILYRPHPESPQIELPQRGGSPPA